MVIPVELNGIQYFLNKYLIAKSEMVRREMIL